MPREKLNLKHGDDGLVAENEASETETDEDDDDDNDDHEQGKGLVLVNLNVDNSWFVHERTKQTHKETQTQTPLHLLPKQLFLGKP